MTQATKIHLDDSGAQKVANELALLDPIMYSMRNSSRMKEIRNDFAHQTFGDSLM